MEAKDMKLPPYYQKNRKVTIYHGGRKVMEGYFIGQTSIHAARLAIENTKLPPAGIRGSSDFFPGDEDWDRNTVNDVFIMREKRDSKW